jgi:hypothetical protein
MVKLSSLYSEEEEGKREELKLQKLTLALDGGDGDTGSS